MGSHVSGSQAANRLIENSANSVLGSTDCEDALLILPGRKRIRSEPSSALNQVNNEHNDGNHEQKMDQTAANVADKAQKPEHHQDDNYSPEHRCFFRLR
jgi:hypothetical protein